MKKSRLLAVALAALMVQSTAVVSVSAISEADIYEVTEPTISAKHSSNEPLPAALSPTLPQSQETPQTPTQAITEPVTQVPTESLTQAPTEPQTQPAPTLVKLNKASITLGVGESYTLTASLTPANAGTTLSWLSSNRKAAVVSNGTITAKAVGTADITVKTANGKTAVCKVTVKNAPTKLSLNKTKLTVGVGEKFDFNSSLPSGQGAYSIKYSTSNNSVAEVKAGGGLMTAKKAGTVTITATTYNGKKASCTVTVKNAPTKLSLNKTKLTVGVGEQFDFNSSLPKGQGAYSIKYSTSNNSVAEVKAGGGLMTAKKAGTVTITATAYNGKKANCTVTVKNAPTKLSLNKTKLTVGVGEQFDFNSSLPSGQGAYSIKYSTSNKSVAEVKASGGLMTAKKAGTVTITATAYNGKKASCTVTVKNPPTKISLNKTKLTVGVGEKFDFNSSLPKGQGAYSIKYSTSNKAVAEVKSSGGLMTAKKAGTVTITATAYNGKKASCTVTVKKAPTSISLNKTSLSLASDMVYDLNSKLPSGQGAYSIKYTSSNPKVASVKANGGLVTAKAEGTATITATTYNGKKVTCKVTVHDPYSLRAYLSVPRNMLLVDYTEEEFVTTFICEKYNHENGYGGYLSEIGLVDASSLKTYFSDYDYRILGEPYTDVYYVAVYITGISYNPNNSTSVQKYQQAQSQLDSVLDTFVYRFE